MARSQAISDVAHIDRELWVGLGGIDLGIAPGYDPGSAGGGDVEQFGDDICCWRGRGDSQYEVDGPDEIQVVCVGVARERQDVRSVSDFPLVGVFEEHGEGITDRGGYEVVGVVGPGGAAGCPF